MKIKKHTYKKIIIAAIAFLLFLSGVFSVSSSAHAAYTYTPMEKIPGFESAATDFPTYLLSIVKFAIWTVGIAALLMIIIGGFMYITSAGNTSRMDSAKRVIFDALYGLIVAFAAWLLLYVINPDLVKVSITLKPVVMPQAGAPGGPGYGIGGCQPVSSGSCSVSSLQSSCFGGNAQNMSIICNVESGGNPNIFSGSDKCKDGNSFSVGLFQINMITSAGSVCNGADIFTINGGGSQGTCLARRNGICMKYDCEVKNKSLYDSCASQLKNSNTNINIACSLSNNGSNLGPWTTTAKRCGL